MKNNPLKINNIYDLIETIKKRPAMFFGDKRISSMDCFLAGYQFSAFTHKIKEEMVFPQFEYFNKWVADRYNCSSNIGWKQIILMENDFDEEKSLKLFFEMIDGFKTLHPISIQKAKITEENMSFHHSDKCKTKRLINNDLNKTAPIYLEADEIFLVEFSHSFKFEFFVRHKNKLIDWNWMYRFESEKSAKKHIESLFGKMSNWKIKTGNLLAIIKQIIKE